jgi:4-hydroxybenzoate polyprenyltransferase
VRRSAAAVFTAAFAALFVLAAAMLNATALALSPAVLVLLLGYSFTKRFTWLSHLVLGLSLGLAPLGAWVAVLGSRCLEGVGTPILLGGAVVLWVAGFDIIYSCMDVDFDRSASLHSIPRRFGVPRALRVSAWLHVGTVVLLVAVAALSEGGPFFPVAVASVAILLWREHRIVRPDDLSRVNQAFFTLNGVVGMVLLAACLVDLLAFGLLP